MKTIETTINIQKNETFNSCVVLSVDEMYDAFPVGISRIWISDENPNLFEPCATIRVLEKSMEYLDPDESICFKPDGTRITNREIVERLKSPGLSTDRDMIEFIQDIHSAAVGMALAQRRNREKK